jgi:hypothetical protein
VRKRCGRSSGYGKVAEAGGKRVFFGGKNVGNRWEQARMTRTPAPEGARVPLAGWLRGGGLGHATRRCIDNARAEAAFQVLPNYFRPAAARPRLLRGCRRSALSDGSRTCRPSGNSKHLMEIRRPPSACRRPSMTYRVPTGKRLGRRSTREFITTPPGYRCSPRRHRNMPPRQLHGAPQIAVDCCESL